MCNGSKDSATIQRFKRKLFEPWPLTVDVGTAALGCPWSELDLGRDALLPTVFKDGKYQVRRPDGRRAPLSPHTQDRLFCYRSCMLRILFATVLALSVSLSAFAKDKQVRPAPFNNTRG